MPVKKALLQVWAADATCCFRPAQLRRRLSKSNSAERAGVCASGCHDGDAGLTRCFLVLAGEESRKAPAKWCGTRHVHEIHRTIPPKTRNLYPHRIIKERNDFRVDFRPRTLWGVVRGRERTSRGTVWEKYEPD